MLLLANFLREQGFAVTETYNGDQALIIANGPGAAISAVITNVNMPGLNGLEMWECMKPVVSSDCKVIFMSGLAAKYIQEGWVFPGELLSSRSRSICF